VGRHLEAGQYVAQSGLHLHLSEPHSCGNVQQTGYKLHSHVNESSVFKLSFSCKQDSAYEKGCLTFK
jgi:hypothetical protein